MTFDFAYCPSCGSDLDEVMEARREGDETAGCLACGSVTDNDLADDDDFVDYEDDFDDIDDGG